MKVVLHVCCGVCAAGAFERLALEGHEVLGLFYNPNIHPIDEYKKRLDAAYKVARELDFPLEEGPYQPEEWFKEAGLMENEPEGGRRCELCFRLRLGKAYLYLMDRGWDAFTTTLTIGPQKSAPVINPVGQANGGERLLARDLKKKAGFQRANELAKKWALYRQDYCGCVYSMWKG